jgi:hypothetical protein
MASLGWLVLTINLGFTDLFYPTGLTKDCCVCHKPEKLSLFPRIVKLQKCFGLGFV